MPSKSDLTASWRVGRTVSLNWYDHLCRRWEHYLSPREGVAKRVCTTGEQVGVDAELTAVALLRASYPQRMTRNVAGRNIASGLNLPCDVCEKNIRAQEYYSVFPVGPAALVICKECLLNHALAVWRAEIEPPKPTFPDCERVSTPPSRTTGDNGVANVRNAPPA